MRQAATTADIIGLTFHNLSWVHVGSDEEEDDAPAADNDDAPVVVDDDDDDGLRQKWRYLQMAMKRSLVIRSAMGR